MESYDQEIVNKVNFEDSGVDFGDIVVEESDIEEVYEGIGNSIYEIEEEFIIEIELEDEGYLNIS